MEVTGRLLAAIPRRASVFRRDGCKTGIDPRRHDDSSPHGDTAATRSPLEFLQASLVARARSRSTSGEQRPQLEDRRESGHGTYSTSVGVTCCRHARAGQTSSAGRSNAWISGASCRSPRTEHSLRTDGSRYERRLGAPEGGRGSSRHRELLDDPVLVS